MDSTMVSVMETTYALEEEEGPFPSVTIVFGISTKSYTK